MISFYLEKLFKVEQYEIGYGGDGFNQLRGCKGGDK